MAINKTQVGIEIVANAGKAITAMSQLSGEMAQLDGFIQKSTGGMYRFSQSQNRWVNSKGKAVKASDAIKRALQAQVRATQASARAYEAAVAGLSKTEKAALQTQGALSKMNHATGSGSFAAISLGQTFQDAGQFGMGAAQGVRAVTNNVQMLFQSMTHMAGQMGGWKKAFKQLGASLAGPAGLLVAFSLVTAGIEFFMNKQMMAAKRAREAKGEFKSFMEVIAANPVIKMAVTQERLGQEISNTKGKLEELKETLGGYIAMDKDGNVLTMAELKEARENVKNLKISLEDLEKQQKNNNEQIRENLAWISTEENLKARILKRNNEIKLSLAELQVSYATQWDPANIAAAKYEQKVKDVLAGGFGGGGVSFMAAMQEMNLKWMEFKQTVTDAGLELEITRSEWAKMVGDGSLDEYLEKLKKAKDDKKEIKTLAEKWAEKMEATKYTVEELSFELEKVLGTDGMILANLRAQTAALEDQINFQTQLNDLKVKGVLDDSGSLTETFGVKVKPKPQEVSKESKEAKKDLFDHEEQMKRLRAQAKNNAEAVKLRQKELNAKEKHNQKLEDIRQRRREIYSEMGADMINASLDMAIGGDSFVEAFGGFLDSWGQSLITQGLLAMKFGALIEWIKQAIKMPGGGFAAAAAGLALVVVAKKLTKASEKSASMGGGSGRGGKPTGNLTGLDQWFTNGMTVDSINSMQGSALAPSTLTGNWTGMNAASNRADRTSMRVELVSSGRNLVSVIANENSASSRRIGAGGVSGGGVGAGQASLQMGSGWDGGFLAKDRSR